LNAVEKYFYDFEIADVNPAFVIDMKKRRMVIIR